MARKICSKIISDTIKVSSQTSGMIKGKYSPAEFKYQNIQNSTEDVKLNCNCSKNNQHNSNSTGK